jgi:DNA topoisomerase III
MQWSLVFETIDNKDSEAYLLFGRCGKCRRYMKLVEAKPKRLFCSTCDETYNVPQQNGSLKLHQELKCPLDEFELIYFTAGAKGKSFVFCPYCYSNPPFSEMSKGTEFYNFTTGTGE